MDVDPVAIAAYTREWDFMVLASELLREVASYVCVAACTLGQAPTWARDQAAVGGNMVRLYKLLSAFLDQTVQKQFETSTIISRLAFETIVNAQYLMANFSPELVNSFIGHSLRHERTLRDKSKPTSKDVEDKCFRLSSACSILSIERGKSLVSHSTVLT